MNLSSFCIERPVFTLVISVLIVLFGGIGFLFLGVREFPSVDPPIITVTTNYPGANAQVMESQITEPLEESINGIAGIRSLTSVSSDGRSTITVEFELSVDLEAAANDVRDRVSRSVRVLPPDVDPPTVAKADANSDAILSMTIQSPNRTLLDLTRIANDVFKERLQTIPGVSEIRIWGEKRYSMKLLLDPKLLAAYNLSPLDIRDALNRENIELPTGRIEGYETELTVRTLGRMTTEEEFNNLIIREDGDVAVKLSDVGRAELRAENERAILRGNGAKPQVAVAITPQPGSNYVAIADEFYRRVEQIKKDLPEDLTLDMALDSTVGIRKAIEEVEETILIAFGLVVLVIFFFLRSFTTTLIPAIAIPVSLISSFFIMYVAGFSINILTLLGIVLATGLVVDDAIVVLENIYAKIERGMKPRQAAHEGSREIVFAILSTTITLAVVFLPIVFLQGLTGRLFREFGVVVAGSVMVSAFVSLTLTPMMSSRMLRAHNQNWLYRLTERFFVGMTNGYARSLRAFIRVRWMAFLIMVGAGSLIYFVGKKLPSELAPLEDKGRFSIFATAPEGTSFEAMDEYISLLNGLVDSLPETANTLSVTSPGFGASVSVNSGFVRATLVDASQRKRSQQQVVDAIGSQVRQLTFARTFITQEQTIGGNRLGGLPVQFVLLAPTFDKLKETLPLFMERAGKSKVFQVLDLNLKFNKPELQVSINRERAHAVGITINDVAQTLQLFFSGQRFGFFILYDKQYQVIGQADRENRDAPLDLASVYVRNNKGQLIQVDNLVRLEEQTGPPQLYRFNRYVSATVSAGLAPGYTLGQGIEEMQKVAEEVLDDSFSTALAGVSKEFADSNNTLAFAFLLALILVYLILAAQFESFRDPLVIMFTVPLALAGALLSLSLWGQTLNIFSQIGIIVLIGIVTKNGILIVEFANQRKAEGLVKKSAVLEAATQRLRPILMTSLATALGALPIALALGSASQSRVGMGISIIGGLLFSLLLTLYIIPALYIFISSSSKQSLQTIAEPLPNS